MRFYIDSAFVKDGQMNCIGWAVPSKKENHLSYQLFCEGKEIPFEIYYSTRADIGFSMLNMPNFPNTGIYVRFLYQEGKHYELGLQEWAQDVLVETQKMTISLFSFQFRENIKNWKAKLRGPIQFAKKVRDKVTHKPEKKYRAWLQKQRVTPELWQAQRETVFEHGPFFSVVVPLYHTPLSFLKACVDSVLQQSYVNLELCLIDAGLSEESLAAVKDYEHQDKRVRVVHLPENLGIAGNTNAGLEMAKGTYICLLDHDDTLELDALYLYAKEIAASPEVGLLYCDEDKMTEQGTDYFFPHFKPDFNLDMLRGNNYICHFLCVKREIALAVGGFSSEFNGAQDFDFILKVVEKCEKVAHIAKILYHWRSSNESTAKNMDNKEYALLAGKKALEAHFVRCGLQVETSLGTVPGWYKNHYLLAEKPLISVLIPNKDHVEDLDICINSLFQVCTYQNLEVLVIENNSVEEKTFAYYEEIQQKYPQVRVLFYQGGFNFSAINNFGEREAKGDYLLLLNNDVEVITPDLLESMMGYCMRSDVGIVGAKLLYADDTIQHAGVLVGAGGVALHLFKGATDTDPCYMCRAISSHDVSCVTAACLLVKKAVYEEVGCMNEQLKVAFNDVDFCLKVRKKGYLIVYDAEAKLHHYESKSRGQENTPEKFLRFDEETRILSEQWNISKESVSFSYIDPYYNPNLSYVQPFKIDFDR